MHPLPPPSPPPPPQSSPQQSQKLTLCHLPERLLTPVKGAERPLRLFLVKVPCFHRYHPATYREDCSLLRGHGGLGPTKPRVHDRQIPEGGAPSPPPLASLLAWTLSLGTVLEVVWVEAAHGIPSRASAPLGVGSLAAPELPSGCVTGLRLVPTVPTELGIGPRRAGEEAGGLTREHPSPGASGSRE